MADKHDKRIAVVTGASRGIGEATALALAAQGRHLVLVSRGEEALNAVKAKVEQQGGTASVRVCDMSDSDSITGMVESVGDEFGRLDILVNNAGMTADTLLLRMTQEQFDQVINVNLRSVFTATKAAARYMIRGKWGRIVNISSVSGIAGNAGQANYAAAKSGVVGFTKSVAKELSGKNITANVVAPGFVETDMTRNLPEGIKDHYKKLTPLRRFGEVEEIAAGVAFFASDEASFVTGQTLAIDGGMTMQ